MRLGAHDRLLGDLALRKGVLAYGQLERALRRIESGEARDLGEALVALGLLPPERVQGLEEELIDTPLASGDTTSPTPVLEGWSPFGRFRNLTEVARGGMGVIYRAVDPAIGRLVAIKSTLPGIALDRSFLERFLREARITGRLQHPNVPPVYEIATTSDGRTYFAMKLIEGQSLARDLAAVRDEPGGLVAARDRLLDQFTRVCDAIAYAHSMDVIHRDLKPDNVMVGRFGEVLVMDWGIALAPGEPVQPDSQDAPTRRLDRPGDASAFESSDRLTLAGTILGTPAYMSPEQAGGDLERIDARTDVFSLGAMLYEILTLERPFADHTLRGVATGTVGWVPVPPSRRSPLARIPAEMDAVVLKAMEVDPARRYASVVELQADVAAFRQGGLLAAVHYTAFQRARKWVRRNRLASVAVLVAGAALAAGVGGTAGLEETRRRSEVEARRRALAEAVSAAAGLPAGDREARYDGAQRVVERARELLQLEPRDEEAGRALGRAALALASLATEDHNWELARLEIAEAAPHLGAGEIDEAKEALETERSREIREDLGYVADALRRVEEGEPRAGMFDEWVTRIVKRPRPHVVAALIPEVVSPSEGRRRLAIEALGKLGDRTTTAPVPVDRFPPAIPRTAWVSSIVRSSFEETYARRRATWLGEGPLASLDAVQVLILRLMPASFQSEVEEAIGIAWALGRLGDERAHDPLDRKRWSAGDSSTRFRRETDAPFSWIPVPAALAEGGDRAPISAGQWVDRGLAKKAKGDVEGALADLDEAIRLDGSHMSARINRGQAYLERGRAEPEEKKQDLQAALDDLDAAVALDPSFPLAWATRAEVHARRGEYEEALRDHGEACRLDPSSPERWSNRAVCRRQAGDFAGAIADLDEAIRLAPDHASLWLNRAGSRHAKGEFDAALAAIEEALRLDPSAPRAWASRGGIRYQKGDLEGALEDFDRAIRLDPELANAYSNRGMVWLKKGELDHAATDFRRATTLEPGLWEAWANLGVAQALLRDREAAVRSFDRALELCPPAQRKAVEAHRDRAMGKGK